MDLRIFEVKRRRDAIALERVLVPQPSEAKRVVPRDSGSSHQQIRHPVSIGVKHLHTRAGQFNTGRSLLHLSSQGELTFALITPVPDTSIHFKKVRQAATKQVN